MLFDTDTLSYVLTYGGTLIIASLTFLGQVTAVGILLIIAGVARLAAYPARALARPFRASRASSKNGPDTMPGPFNHST